MYLYAHSRHANMILFGRLRETVLRRLQDCAREHGRCSRVCL